MKNYLVIGGSSGIGKSLVEILGRENKVYASYCQHPADSSGNIQYFHLDVLSEPMDLSSLPDRIDGFAYCVGAIALKPFARFSTDDFLKDYQLQLLGAVRVLQQIMPKLKQSTHASIVLFSTVAVQTGFNFHTLVSSSKGAVEGFSKALAAELAPNIRVNCIAPSLTDTPLAANLLNTPEKKEATAQRHPLKRVATADEIAALAAFLLSDSASWITGQVMHADGGMSTLKL